LKNIQKEMFSHTHAHDDRVYMQAKRKAENDAAEDRKMLCKFSTYKKTKLSK
jgi:hypothetical protein